MEVIEEELGEIEDYLQREYYPFILEDIDDFYDRMQEICSKSNEMSTLLTEINQDSQRITYLYVVGASVSEEEIEQYINSVNNNILDIEITEYEKMEVQLQTVTHSLYEDVNSCVQNCESDVKNTIVPLSVTEAEMMIKKQTQVMNDLQNEIRAYEARSKDLSMQIAREKQAQAQAQAQKQAQTQTSSSTVSLTESEKENAYKSLLWLYSLKRIVTHSIGILDISYIGDKNVIEYKNKVKLIAKLDADSRIEEVTASLPDNFYHYTALKYKTMDSILNTAKGRFFPDLLTDVTYYIYSQERLYAELELCKAKHYVDISQDGLLIIRFDNFLEFHIKIPDDYPRTLEKITIVDITTFDLYKGVVYKVKSLFKSKVFFSLTDLVAFIEDNMPSKPE